MATIDLQVDGELIFHPMDGGCMYLQVKKDIQGPNGERQLYANDRLFLHGSVGAVRCFAEGILAALPKTAEGPDLRGMTPDQAEAAGRADWERVTADVHMEPPC